MENFEIKTEVNGRNVRISGFVGHTEVISVSNTIFGKWTIGCSSCLPVDVRRAKDYIDCMAAVMEKARELGADV